MGDLSGEQMQKEKINLDFTKTILIFVFKTAHN